MSGTGDPGRSRGSIGERSRPDLSVIIVSWNTRDLLRACLGSLRRETEGLQSEIWVVDNASDDGSPEMVAREFPEVRLVRNRTNRGFAEANNQVLRKATGRYLLLLNPDTEIRPGAVDAALEAARTWGTAVAARLLNPDGSLQHSCFRFPTLGTDFLEALYLHRLLPLSLRGRILLGGYWSHDEARTVDWALGAFLLAPAEAVDAAGPLPEEYPLFGEDLEWCWRLREAGYPVRYCPEAEVVHYGNQSAGQRPAAWRIRRTHAMKRLFLRLHHGPVRGLVHRWVDLLGYALRAAAFTFAGPFSERRRRMGREYRTILRVIWRDGHGSLRPEEPRGEMA